MLRREQNQIILAKITEKLADQPNVQQQAGKMFAQWFNALAQAGAEQIKVNQQSSAPAAGGAGGGQPT